MTSKKVMAEDQLAKCLLAQYNEAGQLCRQFESQIRVTLTAVFAVFALFFERAILNHGAGELCINLVASIACAIAAFSGLYVADRQKRYYEKYLNAIKAIEGKLNMNLYTKNGLHGLGNKQLILYALFGFYILALFAILFLIHTSFM